MSTSPDGSRAWPDATAAADQLQESLIKVRLDPAGTIEAATAELASGSRQSALTILRVLSTDYTKRLIAPLLKVALVIRYTHIVRELLGAMSYHDAQKLVPDAVFQLLDEEDDGDAYRRMAELLNYLGLNDALTELCRRADDSIDPDVREVASDFAEL